MRGFRGRAAASLASVMLGWTASVALVAGCGGEEGGVTIEGASERTVETEAGAVSIAYPDEWGELERSEGEGTTIYAAASPEGDAFVELRVTEDSGASFEATSQVAAASTAANSGFSLEIDETEPYDLDGAAEAERVTYGPGTLADDETGTLAALFAETDSGTFISLGAGADAGVEFDPAPIVETLRIDE